MRQLPNVPANWRHHWFRVPTAGSGGKQKYDFEILYCLSFCTLLLRASHTADVSLIEK